MAGHPLRSSDLPPGGGVAGPAGAPGQISPGQRGQRESLTRPDDARLPIASLAVWVALQVGAVALAAFRVPMAAQYPQPAEFQGVRVMLAVQFAAVALLCSSLLRSRGAAVITVATSWLTLLLAAALAARRWSEVLPVATFLTLWIAALALACQAVASPHTRAIISAAASLYVIGGGLLAYFHQDFSPALIAHPEIAFGPLFTAVSTPLHLPPLAWAEAAVLDLIAILAYGYTATARTSAPHPSPPERCG